MAYGPKSKKRRAHRMRVASRLAQAIGYDGARHLMLSVPPIFRPEYAAVCAAVAAGYGAWKQRKAY